jgi:hypothetical protein
MVHHRQGIPYETAQPTLTPGSEMSKDKKKLPPKETETVWENGKLVEKSLDDGIAFDVLAAARPPPKKRRGPDTEKRRKQLRVAILDVLVDGDRPTTIAGLARKVHIKRLQKKLTTADSHKADEDTIRNILERSTHK